MRTKLSRESIVLTLVLVVVSIGASFVARSAFHYPAFIPFAVVFATGAVGGAFSFKRRLQQLPSRGESLTDLVELDSGSGMYFSPIAGGLFAIVLFGLFASGLAKGAVFPDFGDAAGAIKGLLEFSSKLSSVSAENWGKLLIWSFIAGFAERFVPDTLDRLIARTEHSGKGAD
jgi:hypothetical protein